MHFVKAFEKVAGRENLQYLDKILARAKAKDSAKTVARFAAGGAAGAAVGAASDPERRGRNAILGALAGSHAAAVGGKLLHRRAVHKAVERHQGHVMNEVARRMQKYRSAESRLSSNIGGNKAKAQARSLARQQYRTQHLGAHQVALTLRQPPKELASKLEGVESTAQQKKITGDWLHGKLQERFPDWKGPGKWRNS